MEDETRIISTVEELKVVSDPFRLRIIKVYSEHPETLTVKGCADILGEVPARVHYHVKKLLAINVLALDHIEIVNGINAKYYKLPKPRLKLQLKEQDEKAMSESIKHLDNVVISQLENFKMDFLNMSRETFERKEENPYEVGWLSSVNIYMNEEEFDEIQTYVFERLEKLSKKDDKKRKYVFIAGLSRKE